jgi:phosphocarrier protein FPr
MIGLVLVSHSAKLAEGVREIAEQMTGGRVPIAVAGGFNDADHPIGTDPMKVHAAVESVYSQDGVIVFMDLGSALMSAESALEWVDADWKAHVHLSDAPFVEGVISAAVQASIGSTVEAVLAEARASLMSKQVHLSSSDSHPDAPTALPVKPTTARRIRVIMPNKLGLHARPAAKLVKLIGAFNAQVTIEKGERQANGRSMSQVSLLAARQGEALDFWVEGSDAEPLISAIQALAHDNFGDLDSDAEPDGVNVPSLTTAFAQSATRLMGMAASKGLAIGNVFFWDDEQTDFTRDVRSIEEEHNRFDDAILAARHDLEQLIQRQGNGLGRAETAIFDAHRLMLEDDELIAQTRADIARTQRSADAVWWAAIEALSASYRQSDNVIVQARAADVLDVGKRVLQKLNPNQSRIPRQLPDNCVLVASDLSPSETAQLDRRKVIGILTQYGGATSHTAIIARSLGIPAVVGLGQAYTRLVAGSTVIVDGDQGWVEIAPSADQIDAYRQVIMERQTAHAQLRQDSRQSAITPDQHPVHIAANIGSAADAAGVLDLGAEGVGLFRTELYFMDRATAPDEAQQFDAYSAAAAHLAGCPLIIRTLDVGGDKPIAYIDIPHEDNPFLGYRGIRYWLDQEVIARAQLRAICRVSAQYPVKIMFPMISTLDEVLRARQLVRAVQAQLAEQSIPFDADMEIGIMIEVPSMLMIADQLAQHVDFFSIGTNDLTQYLMAADRGNARVSHLASVFQPALLRAIHHVIESAHRHHIWVGICGEMAGNARLTPLLLGMGVDELSMSAAAIPEVKAIIRRTSYAQAKADASHILTLSSAAEVEGYLSSL